MNIASVFGKKGRLDKAFEFYTQRPQQIEMAKAMGTALSGKKHCIVEAPCGIGKTFAYLVPIFLRIAEDSEFTAMILTANKTLQNQLVEVDIPSLMKAMQIEASYCSLKGMSNYVCLQRTNDIIQSNELFRDKEDLYALKEYLDRANIGDDDEFPSDLHDMMWKEINVDRALCTGQQCSFFNQCFLFNARKRAKGCNIVVANYHLFFFDLALRKMGSDLAILPTPQALVCDEAHELSHIGRESLGFTVDEFEFERLAKILRNFELVDASNLVAQAGRELFHAVENHIFFKKLKVPYRVRKPLELSLYEKALGNLSTTVEAIAMSMKGGEDDEFVKKMERVQRSVEELKKKIVDFFKVSDLNKVYVIEREFNSYRLRAMLLEIKQIFREFVLDEIPTVAMTSATLAAGGSFDYISGETGFNEDEAESRLLDSPFDYPNCVRVYVSPVKPSDKDAYEKEISGSITKLANRIKGKMMFLFTSVERMKSCCDIVRKSMDFPDRVLRQFELSKAELLQTMKDSRGHILFATRSFWEGVDIPGIKVLGIDKIPFEVPTEPLIDAMQEKMGDQDFWNWYAARANLFLKQGMGRLIRRDSDSGIIVVYDERLLNRWRWFLNFLPPECITTDLESALSVVKT